jgi:lysyl endopeptidase
MQLSCCRLTAVAALALCLAVPAGAGVHEFQWDVQAQPETIGTARDPMDHAAGMRQLQERLASRQVERALRAPAVVELTPAERQRVDDTNGQREMRYFVGIAKPAGITVDFTPARSLGKRTADLTLGSARGNGEGGFVWTAALRSPGATALRAHITGLDLPAGAALFVYNDLGHAFGPYTARGPLGDGVLHTNTVFGEQMMLQLVMPRPGRAPQLRIEKLGVMGQRFTAPRFGPIDIEGRNGMRAMAGAAFCSYNADCVENAACQSNSAVNTAKDAVAGMLFASGGGYYICTGGLLADTVSTSVIPYFLTANHCVGSSGEASSLETFFDYETTCNSPNCTQPYNNTGHTVGATILKTSSTSDYTLLQLASTPVSPDGVTTYLGWTSTAVANSNGTALYRISHPSGSPQAYSEHSVDTSKGTCRSWPRGNWIYSRDTYGATEGGSSGSPVVNSSGQVVGQLSGACGTNVNDNCDPNSNATVDGAFAAYYSGVASWLNPGSGGGTCSPKGASCTSASQCCSNNCGGKPTAKTCK